MLLFYLGLLVAFTTVFCELAARRDWMPYWVSRKILHVVAVGSCAVAGYTADSLGHRELLTWIVAGAEVVLIGLVGFGGLMREESGRRAWGIVWFPLAFLVLLVVGGSSLIGFSMLVLAICDPAATIVGKLMGQNEPLKASLGTGSTFISINTRLTKPYQLTGDPKTLAGNLAFVFTFMLISTVDIWEEYVQVSHLLRDIDPNVKLLDFLPSPSDIMVYLAFGIIVAAGEALGSKGLDNFIIPFLVFLFYNSTSQYAPGGRLVVVTVLASLFVILAISRKSLSPGGAVTAGILGIIILYFANFVWSIPLLLFFVSSSLIGKLCKRPNAASDDKQNQPRDTVQVLANGSIYCILVVFNTTESSFMGDWFLDVSSQIKPFLLLTAATATADTWSSELGQYFRRPTWDLIKWRRVPAGLSGGVSWPGTLAGLGGAALIANLGWWLLPEPSLQQILLITGFGFLGMLIDSVLGSLLQATYRDPATGALSDVRPEGGELASGFPWMTNDLVNFLAIGLTALVAVLVIG